MEDFRLVGHFPVSEKEGSIRCGRKWKGESENRRWLSNREEEKDQNNSKEHIRSSSLLEMNSRLILHKNFCVTFVNHRKLERMMC